MLGVAVGRNTIKAESVRTYTDLILQMRRQYGILTFQLFVMGPNNFERVDLGNERFRALVKNGVRVYAHASYVVSIAKTKANRIHGSLLEQYNICADHHMSGLVCHLLKREPSENFESIAAMFDYSRRKHSQTKFIFEINGVKTDDKAAGESHTFESAEKINHMIQKLKSAGYTCDDGGFCLDTSHVWTGGISMKTATDVRKWLDTIVDPCWIKLIHLNDSASEIGGRDIHTWVGTGKIWQYDLKHDTRPESHGFYEILRWAKCHGVDVILERHGGMTPAHIGEMVGLKKIWDKI